jgi:hypothetical protein
MDKQLGEDILLEKEKLYQAKVQAKDLNNDVLSFEWEIYPENTKFGYAGQGEKRPVPLNHLIQNRNEAVVSFTAPSTSGDYRVFIYVRDKGNKIAVANIPFHVD